MESRCRTCLESAHSKHFEKKVWNELAGVYRYVILLPLLLLLMTYGQSLGALATLSELEYRLKWVLLWLLHLKNKTVKGFTVFTNLLHLVPVWYT